MSTPSLTIVVEPVESNSVRYLPLSPQQKGGAGGVKLVVRLAITNAGSSAITISSIVFSYPGTSIPAKTMAGVDSVLGEGGSIEVGETRYWSNGVVTLADESKVDNAVYLDLPAPPTLKIEVSATGFDKPAGSSHSLAPYVAANGKGYPFPFAIDDFRQAECVWVKGSHWANGGAPGGQIYALDVGIAGWDAAANKWSETLPGTDGSKNEHWRGWGRPIRAVADGTVAEFHVGMADNTVLNKFPDPTPNPVGGNHLWIDSGNEKIYYTHMQNGSIPAALQKKGAQVKKGQFLGLMGNSGNATNPHVHLEVRRDISTSPLRPWALTDAWLVDASLQKPFDPSGAWVKVAGTCVPRERVVVWPASQAPTWYPPGWGEITHHGVPESGYQALFDKIHTSGYRLVWLDGYEHAGQTFFNVIFRPAGSVAWRARHNMSGTKYQEEFDQQRRTATGWRTSRPYMLGSSLRYAAVWEKRSGPAWRAYHGRTADEHQALFDEWTADGYRPVNVAVVATGTQRSYAAFYEKVDVGGFRLKSFLTPDEYQAEWDVQVGQKGRHVAYLSAYQHGGGARFSAVFQEETPGTGGTVGRHNLSSSGYQSAHEKFLGEGLLTRCVAGYTVAGAPRFAAIWRG